MSVKIINGAIEAKKIQEPKYNGIIIRAPSFDSNYKSLCDLNNIDNKIIITKSNDVGKLFYGMNGDEGKILALEAKVKYMISLYFSFVNVKQAKVQLYTQTKNSCVKFHVDMLKLRLICTLSGPTTELISNNYVNRENLTKSNDLIISDFSKIVKPDINDICLLKGECWPENKGNGIVHRSPENETKRLIFSIDDLT